MIIVNSALKQKEIIEVVENIKRDNKNIFKFNKKQGIKLYFDVVNNLEEDLCFMIKLAIKSQSFGSALFFNVMEE